MMVKTILLMCLVAVSACKKSPANPEPLLQKHAHGIIPLPLKVELNQGKLLVDKNSILVSNSSFAMAVATIEASINQSLNTPVTIADKPGSGSNIQFITDNSIQADAYLITINSKGIEIKANSPAAAFYAAQSVRQMIWNVTSGEKANSFEIQNMVIEDKPLYSWRGFHLDVSRHFFTKEYLFKIIDWLAYYKLNVMHLHLTDDQGWRVQIDQFPLLTEVGAWRSYNDQDSSCLELAGTDPDYEIDKRFIKEVNGKPVYGGYYTKQDIRDIVAYAGERFIDVIPEVDMPGHMSAAIRAYPFLSCVNTAGWGTEFSYPICPCNEQTMDFAYKVWDEIADLFPSKFVHIGCDEVEKSTWASSPECQSFMTQNNISTLNGIQNYFVKKLQEHLQAKGKIVIAWDDVIEGEVDGNLTMMYWRDWVTDSPERCASNGNNIILTPASPFYLASINRDTDLENLYKYNPADLYSPAVLGKIKGLQTCVWTEIVPSERMFEKYVFPRMQALAEICWSPARSWSSFIVRMQPQFRFMNAYDINYRNPGWQKLK